MNKNKYQNHIDRITEKELKEFGENTFFTSDLHFFHENIIKYCDRPWSSVDKMNKGLIQNWNDIVPEDADVYITGDLGMMGNDKAGRLTPILNKLKGRKHLIYGNHDRISHSKYIDIGIFSVHYPYLQLSNGWICLHDPALATACPKNSVIISGHVHNLYGKFTKASKGKTIIDVGVDSWDYKPVSMKEINNLLGV